MGKITSIYLTDKEASELKRFCDENQCTQYSAIKMALRELLFKPTEELNHPSFDKDAEQESGKDETFEIEQPDKTGKPLSQLVQKLRKLQ